MIKILIVDDERTARKGLYFSLKKLADSIKEAENIKQAEALLRAEEFDLVISDLRMPNEEQGLNLVKKVKQIYPLTPLLMITAYGSVDSAVLAMKAGADDYITKDFSREELVLKIGKMLQTRKLWLTNLRLSDQVHSLSNEFSLSGEEDQIVGNSPPMKEIMSLVTRVGLDRDSTVLISGESGTGKELIARAIHRINPHRNKHKFVVVDVANMPATLLESQLFGHEKGAFTNALQKHSGYFEIAQGGMVFLDEIGDFPLELQVKLLRFLQEKTFMRVGGEAPIRSDVRIVAATNKNLKELVEKERFREDLFYRLNVVNIHLPPLRERRQDIMPLIEYFREKFTIRKERRLQFPEAIIDKMKNYSWPGNIRQLKNFLESLYVTCPEDVVREKDLNFEEVPAVNNDDLFQLLLELPFKEAKQRLIEKFERFYLGHHLRLSDSNISKLASTVGESREGISKKVKRYNLKNSL